MQIKKAGAVAVGAIATVAAMGTSAAASPTTGPAQLGSASVLTAPNSSAQAITKAVTKNAFGLGANDTVQPLLSVFGGSSLLVAPWQFCGSTATAGVGAAVAASSPNTVLGDCTNANVKLKQDTAPALISLFDDSSVNLAPWQVCGSTVVGGVGATVALNSPNTVTGDCDNASTKITAPDHEHGPKSLLSLFSGSSLDALAWQTCGSTAVMGVGAAAGFNSPTTVVGSCTDAMTTIEDREQQAVIPLLSNTGVNLVPIQVCASDSLLGIVGLSPAINSPANVFGGCDKGSLITNGS
ncbi:hypothetical protein F4553_003321 [Allocatelliglobosispora scoriae]|uniref:Secreted protein n=1 Tax=Allocatelliglobosispora scoriae TaxID=643052 RepID=A0A841BT72_9ACTN|nr:hypothetical protein [Allocatelliglobosispora scoriae]MBB5869942.1 hypothetical protein [Allocatelliglobosispora scoriae]